jgi:hypothetical protein
MRPQRNRPQRNASLPVVEGHTTLQHMAVSADSLSLRDVLELQRKQRDSQEMFLEVNSAQNINMQAAIHFAAEADLADNMLVLLTYGAQLEQQDVLGRTPLLYCAKLGHFNLAKLLIRMGSNVHASDKFGDNGLHLAAGRCHFDLVCLFAEHFDVNVQNSFGETALHKASRSGDSTIVSWLLMHGAKLDIMGENGSPIDVCSHLLVQELLLKALAVGNDEIPVSILPKHDEDAGSIMLSQVELVDITQMQRQERNRSLMCLSFVLPSNPQAEVVQSVVQNMMKETLVFARVDPSTGVVIENHTTNGELVILYCVLPKRTC